MAGHVTDATHVQGCWLCQTDRRTVGHHHFIARHIAIHPTPVHIVFEDIHGSLLPRFVKFPLWRAEVQFSSRRKVKVVEINTHGKGARG